MIINLIKEILRHKYFRVDRESKGLVTPGHRLDRSISTAHVLISEHDISSIQPFQRQWQLHSSMKT